MRWARAVVDEDDWEEGVGRSEAVRERHSESWAGEPGGGLLVN